MKKIENDFNKRCSPKLLFQYKNRFQEDEVDFWTKELTLKTGNVNFLTSVPQVGLQNIKKILSGGSLGRKNLLNFSSL